MIYCTVDIPFKQQLVTPLISWAYFNLYTFVFEAFGHTLNYLFRSDRVWKGGIILLCNVPLGRVQK